MSKRILILGAGFLQQFIIKRAKELGYYTIAVDGNANAAGFNFADEYAVIDISDKNLCYEYAKTKDIDGVLTGATEYGVISCAYISEKLLLPGNSLDVATMLRNKYRVRQRLIEFKVDDISQCFEISDINDIDNINIKFPVIVKPCEGSGSRGVYRANNIQELINACKLSIEMSKNGKAEVEDYIEDGKEYGVESFVNNGTVSVLGILVKSMTNKPDHAELGHAIENDVEITIKNKLIWAAKKAINVLGITHGGVNMDILVDDDKIYIVDIGMRMGGNLIGSHLIPIGTGIDYMGNLIKQAVGDNIQMDPIFPISPIATKILDLSPGKVKEIPDVELIESKYNVNILHHLTKGDVISEYHNNLDGCGYVIATADKTDKAIENAQSAKEKFDQQIVRG